MSDVHLTEVKIYSDGSSRGNPGPGGYGSIIQFRDGKGQVHEKEFSCGYKVTTNNRMELLGAIVALEGLTRPCHVVLTSDSKYLVDAFNQGWIYNWQLKGWRKSSKEPVKNVDLWERLLAAMKPHKVDFVWVKGHDGHPENERCDKLATTAADGEDLQEDDWDH
ncbi:MAG: ribonuclease HI [Lachnospiraceae bacterium]|nr:ribonuclease HI [Lachnospiraceae bacterium]